MRLFIWKELDHLTTMYHDDGGAAVMAESEDEAWHILKNYSSVVGKDEWDESSGEWRNTFPPPLFSCEVPDWVEQQLFVFPNAGCC